MTEKTTGGGDARLEGGAVAEDIINSLPGSFYVYDDQWRLVRWNKRHEQIMGYSAEELRHKHALAFFEGDDRDAIAKAIEKVFREGSAEVEATVTTKAGARIPCFFTGRRSVLNGRPHLLGLGIDISARVNMERNLSSRADRIMCFHKCLLKLSRADFSDPDAQVRQIIESDAKAMQVERVSVWLFNQGGTAIACDDLYELTRGTHQKGGSIEASRYPRYFEALRESRTIAAADAWSDDRTCEFAEGYLKPQGITSMLDAPVWLHGGIVGIVCHEHVGPKREWLPEEQDFAASIADMISLAMEAADRMRAEEALGRSEEEFRQLVENVPIGVYRSTPEGRMLMANPTMVSMLGYSSLEELAKRDLDDESRHHGYARSAYKERIEREGRIVGQESVWERSDGSMIHVRENARAVFDQAGRAIYYEGTIEDITEQKWAEGELRKYHGHLEELVRARTAELEGANKQLQDEIREREKLEADLIQAREAAESANRAKSVFLANMSHGIRTPMNAILGYTQILQRDKTIGRTQSEYVDIIGRSAEHLLGLINDILEMSKIEAGRAMLNPEEFDFHAMLDDIEAMLRARTAEKGLSLAVSRVEGVPRYLLADGGKVRDVVINLLGNSVKFTDRGGITVRVTSRVCREHSADHVVSVDVADTGCGIAPDEIDRAFEPFEQTKSGRFQGSGTGLGLPISREYARMMGGDLTVESVAGMGSTFRFTFQAKAVEPADIRRAAEDRARQIVGLAPDRPAPKVLVVDDDEPSREALALHLEMVGFDVHSAADGKAALEVFEQWGPDVILMDLWMPEMDGLEAMRRIKASPRGAVTPILAVTASVLEDSEKDAVAAGADGFVRKPFRKAEIFHELKRVLGIEYVYERAAGPESERSAPSAQAEAAEVPAGLMHELMEATESGDAGRLRCLLEEHRGALGGALTDTLLALACDYEYDGIREALRGTVVGSGQAGVKAID
ncbi:MAG: PAS domain S-box protein [bacterium]